VALWESLIDGLGELLRFFHGLIDPIPLLGVAAWGWAIMLLTVTIRVLLIPLAVKQINSMRAMQQLQPQMKKIQTKYKADRSMMRTDPEKYREKRQKQQEEMMKLYKEHNVNPAAGCLPLVAQAPIFIALFYLLRDDARVPELFQEGFYFIGSLGLTPTGEGNAGAYVLVALMGITTYLSQRQMMANNPTASVQPQQKILLYVMPIMLTVFAFNFPVGVVLYWVTTNLWTMAQQFIMFRRVEPGTPPGNAKATHA
jgi:YidC/Oxa1 family membrane protein insertase